MHVSTQSHRYSYEIRIRVILCTDRRNIHVNPKTIVQAPLISKNEPHSPRKLKQQKYTQ